MKKDTFGVWEITIPPTAPGVCAIPHDSKIKVHNILFSPLFSANFFWLDIHAPAHQEAN